MLTHSVPTSPPPAPHHRLQPPFLSLLSPLNPIRPLFPPSLPAAVAIITGALTGVFLKFLGGPDPNHFFLDDSEWIMPSNMPPLTSKDAPATVAPINPANAPGSPTTTVVEEVQNAMVPSAPASEGAATLV